MFVFALLLVVGVVEFVLLEVAVVERRFGVVVLFWLTVVRPVVDVRFVVALFTLRRVVVAGLVVPVLPVDVLRPVLTVVVLLSDACRRLVFLTVPAVLVPVRRPPVTIAGRCP